MPLSMEKDVQPTARAGGFRADNGRAIEFSFAIAIPYQVPLVTLLPGVHQLELVPTPGSHVYTSPDLVLGRIHSLKEDLVGRVTFRYTYEDTNQTLTLCGPDYASGDGMALITMPRALGAAHASVARASGRGLTVDDAGDTRYWDYTTPLTPGLGAIFVEETHRAVKSLIRNAIAGDNYNVRIRQTLEIPLDLLLAASGPNIRELYGFPRSGGHDHGGSDTGRGTTGGSPHKIDSWLHPGGGKGYFTSDQFFANGEGTKDDPKIKSMDWMPLWRLVFEDETYKGCTSKDYGKACTVPPFTQMGAHVIFSKTAETIKKGASCYIVPLCPAHNHYTWRGTMMPIDNRKAVWLDGFDEKSQ